MLRSNKSKYARANDKARTARVLLADQSEAGRGSAKALEIDNRLRQLVRPGYYEHFKSSVEKPMFYLVYEVLSHVNYQTHDHLYQVSYAALYPPHAGRKTLRELLGDDGFLTPIMRPEYVGPRFCYVGKKLPQRASKSKTK